MFTPMMSLECALKRRTIHAIAAFSPSGLLYVTDEEAWISRMVSHDYEHKREVPQK